MLNYYHIIFINMLADGCLQAAQPLVKEVIMIINYCDDNNIIYNIMYFNNIYSETHILYFYYC